MKTESRVIKQRSVLGRGLSALISATPVPVHPTESPASGELELRVVKGGGSEGSSAVFIDLDRIVPNPFQPRQMFDEAEVSQLAESIKSLGVLQPILVRPSPDFETSGRYELIAGERRYRACLAAGLKQVPALVRKIDDRQSLEIALVENVQRENLNPVELARAYQRLIDEFSLSQEEVAAKVGKDRTSVANMTRLLRLPPEILEMLQSGELSTGHAKAVLSIQDRAAQLSLAKKAQKEGLSVRALESLVAQVEVLDVGPKGARRRRVQSEASVLSSFPEIVERLRNVLGTKVLIRHHPSGRGRLEIEYFSEQELDGIVQRICGDPLKDT